MITVVFSTKNSEARIERTLTAFVGLDSEEDWQLVVIDNGSTDSTASILDSYRHKLPLLLLKESKPGKNVALNQSISHFDGDLIVFTDDDVRFDKDWLTRIRSVADSNADYSIFGGNIKPEWEVKPDNWILEWAPLGHLYAIKTNPQEGECKPGYVWGPNMVVRACVFEDKQNVFDERIGPNGTSDYPMGSETDFTTRMYSKGYKCWNSNEFEVYHWVPKSHISVKWIYERAFRLGKGVTLAKYLHSKNISAFNLWIKWIKYLIVERIMNFIPFSKKVFWSKYKLNYVKGELTALKLIAKNK